MKYYIVSVRDIVADCYMAPIFVPNLGSAIRSFGDACKNKEPNNPIGTHPEDFELHHIGGWDDQHAEFDTSEKPKQIAVGRNYAT